MNKKIFAKDTIRLHVLFGVYIFVLIVFSLKLFYVQIIRHNDYSAMAESQHWNVLELPARRGEILFSDKSPLALNQRNYLLYMEPKRIEDKERFSIVLSEKLNLISGTEATKFDYNKILEIAKTDLYYAIVARDLNAEQKKQIEELELPGLGFEESTKRSYPHSTLASHILGFVAHDESGVDRGYFGLEGVFDGDLKGKPGYLAQEKDALGVPIMLGNANRVDPVPGRNLITTLDSSIQYMVEKELEAGVKEYRAKAGTVIVMNPANGDILAMANYPTFNPEKYAEEAELVDETTGMMSVTQRNNAISKVYEPGSVMKPFTVASAIDLGLVTPETTFTDNGPVQYSDYFINNWDGVHYGELNIIQLLQKSNNIGAAWVGHKVGAERLHKYFQDFGFGKRTGVDLEGDDSGVLRPYEEWYDIDTATISFGQGISATPLQVLAGFNAFVNGGVLYRPRIVSQIDERGHMINIPTVEVRRVISTDTANTMVYLLEKAAEGGEGRYFNMKKYRLAGKTGTAQIPVDGKYDPNRTNTTFLGFLPGSKKYTMLVKLEEPTSSIYAAETALPLWMKISSGLVQYYGLVPDSESGVSGSEE